ncbi:phage tail assembly chaperone [Mesorhizobium sp. 128a]
MLARRLPEERRAELEAELACPPMPEAMDYLWRAFARLSNRRGAGGMWSWSDLDAFNRLAGLRLAPWEVDIIERLDRAYLVEASRKRDG